MELDKDLRILLVEDSGITRKMERRLLQNNLRFQNIR